MHVLNPHNNLQEKAANNKLMEQIYCPKLKVSCLPSPRHPNTSANTSCKSSQANYYILYYK